MTRAMLDTNAYAALLSGDARVTETLSCSAGILMPLFVLGELEAGFRGGSRHADNSAILRRFLAKSGVREAVSGRETARIYGEIKHTLKRAGTPIPNNDIWIAASAIEHAATLVTYDRHFLAVPRLKLWPHVAAFEN